MRRGLRAPATVEPATAAPVASKPATAAPMASERLRGGGRRYATATVVCAALVALIWLLVVLPNGQASPRADVARAAARLQAVAPYQIYLPRPLPAGWQATDSRITGTRGNGPVAWHLGCRTAGGGYAALEESDENPAAFVPRMANRDRPVGTRMVSGAAWERYYRPDKRQYSLARRLPGVTLVVTGTASYDELAALAAALRPRPSR